jgi:hypothetical protein
MDAQNEDKRSPQLKGGRHDFFGTHHVYSFKLHILLDGNLSHQKMVGRYQPLPHGNHFRILELQPGQTGDPIVCKLLVAQIPSPRPTLNDISYEALSYVWGPEKPEHEIVLDGWPCIVRDNLWHFLRQRRHQSQVSRLWIDALCIIRQISKSEAAKCS